MVLGAILAVLLILFAVVAVHGMADDRTSKGYADTATVAIISDWNEQALLDRASPDLIQVTTREQMDSFFARLRGLGRMTKYASSSGRTITSFDRFPWTVTTTAVYVAKADFEHGSAQIKITLIKRSGAWRILAFSVNGDGNQGSPARWHMPVYLPIRPCFA